jgi:hypothetical protein
MCRGNFPDAALDLPTNTVRSALSFPNEICTLLPIVLISAGVMAGFCLNEPSGVFETMRIPGGPGDVNRSRRAHC